ncbi:lytic transglycosylase domain-containing protein [Natroniella sulfidigena]|uniref:lytic transglycosylase domain-containing protein n=1 Tax=Natroniella sulfidigena TaxID=723921 RepID=UPI00200AA981|nr:lytic transglycosylase domain-containing protein [Natroniella sulfidigena]MCK8815797.1 lytic transglycosylase domain-containing protein [Natroniella sulfidigena]
MKIEFKKITWLLIFLVLFSLLFIVHKDILELVYPLDYQELIFSEAERYDLDPYLIISIIYVESKFRPQATSAKGARGLMQIMPPTGVWIAEKLDDQEFSVDDLYEPELNIKYGSWYLAELKQQFDNRTMVIAAYNGGQGNVKKWLHEKQWDGEYETINQIPFAETRNYVSKVARAYSIYRYIYTD